MTTDAPRIGIAVVGDGAVVGREVAACAPAVTFALRSFSYPLAAEPFCDGLAQRMAEAALALRAWGADLVLLACTTALMRCSAETVHGLLAATTGLPIVSVAEAMVAEARALEGRALAIATPYGRANNEVIGAYFEQAGFTVRSLVGLDLDRSPDVWRARAQTLDASEIIALARAADHPEADAICLPSTGIAAAAVASDIARLCRKPVVTAIGAGLRSCFDRLGADPVGAHRAASTMTESLR